MVSRMDDFKSFESEIESQDRATRWRLETNSGDVYYTLNSFVDIMDTNRWYPKHREGKKSGFIMRELMYHPVGEEKQHRTMPVSER